jgi:hypothetical protein
VLELLLVSLSVFFAWNTIRPLLPFGFSNRLSPVVVGVIAWAIIMYATPVLLMAGAAAGAACFLSLVAGWMGMLPPPQHWDWRMYVPQFRIPRRRSQEMGMAPAPRGPGNRIPRLGE